MGGSYPATLPQAVTEYKRRYGRSPPKGFEVWWQFAKKNNIKIVDDYDQIFRDIEPYFALSPKLFRQRCDQLNTTGHTYHVKLSPDGTAEVYGDRSHTLRVGRMFDLLQPLAKLLPAEVTMHGSDHDLGSWILTDDLKQLALTAIRDGRYLTEQELKRLETPDKNKITWRKAKGRVAACPEGSLSWNRSLILQKGQTIEEEPQETTFIHDSSATYDFCDNPSLLKFHGSLSFDVSRESMLRPLFQWSKFNRNPEFLATPLEAYDNITSAHGKTQTSPWSEKTISKLFWRGRGTGDAYGHRKDYDWRNSHRPRLSLMAQEEKGEKTIWVERGRKWVREAWSNKKLNEVYMDVGLMGEPHQCNKEDGTCDEMAKEIKWLDKVSPQQSVNYKYVFDIDGNGWSSRFHRLITSGSLVLKATIYPEWMSDWLTPWVHYVPVQIDYSDVYSILSFFIGPPDGRSGGHDHLAQEIAERGKQFAEEYWRWEDMQGYMFRLLLEYIRLQADDRDAWSYGKTYD